MSERLYSLVLQLYPSGFRARYGEEMAHLFRDRLDHESATRVWIDVLADAATSIPREHWAREPHPIYPPSAAPLREIHRTVTQEMAAGGIVGAALAGGVWAAVDGGLSVIVRNPLMWIGAAVILVLCAITFQRAFRARRRMKAFRTEVLRDTVTVTYHGMALLTLQRSDVIRLHDFANVGLRIESADPARDLWVPARSESYATVKALVSQWVPPSVTPLAPSRDPKRRRILPAAIVPGLLVLYVIVLVVPAKWPLLPGLLSGFAIGRALYDCASWWKKLLFVGPAVILFVRVVIQFVRVFW